jgi:DNA-directed RNA polymerase subunit RPC12/RpoP
VTHGHCARHCGGCGGEFSALPGAKAIICDDCGRKIDVGAATPNGVKPAQARGQVRQADLDRCTVVLPSASIAAIAQTGAGRLKVRERDRVAT